MTGVTDNRIKILFLIDTLYWGGGTETHLTQVVTKLDKRKFFCMVCPFEPSASPAIDVIRGAGVPCEPLLLKKIYGFRAFINAFRLARIIRDYHFDIVQTFHFASDTYGAIIAKLCNGPIVVSSRRDMNLYKSKLQTSVCRITNRFIDRFITVSDAVSQNIIRAEKVSPGRVFRLYNGVDHSEFSKTDNAKIRKFKNSLGIPENSFVVGTISNFLPVKGYDTFFTAIAEVAHVIDGLKVLAVGDGPLLEGMQQRCRRDEHLRDRVIFPGLVPNVRDYISAMDVACLASRSEGFSNAILEKMAIGKPVIATDVGGNRELVLDGVSGFLVPPSNPEKMAQSILRLFDDSALRRQMGENARKRIESDFTLEKMIANVEAFYSALCEEKQNGKH